MENSDYKQLIDECKDYTVWRLNRNIIFMRFMIFFLNPVAMWLTDITIWGIVWSVFIWSGLYDLSITTVTIFFCIHFVYWEFYQKKEAKELIDDLGGIDLRQALKALKDVKREKIKKI
jgi:hypothetical protein